jgi:hypothetical protein
MYKKPIASIKLKNEEWKLPSDSTTTITQHCLEILSNQEKKGKCIIILKEQIKLSLFINDIVVSRKYQRI